MNRAAFVLAALLLAPPARAEGLKKPLALYAVAASADAASTVYSFRFAGVHEQNPLVSHWEGRPAEMFAIGGAMEIGALWLGNRLLGERHPTALRRTIYVIAAARLGIAAKNVSQTRGWRRKP